MHASKLLPIVFLWLGAAVVARAETHTEAEARIKTALAQLYPGSTVEAVHASGLIPGWFEVVTPDEILYTDADANHLLVGKLVDTHTKEDLTAKRLNALHAIDFQGLPFDLAVRIVRGNGSRKLAIFEDPLCPYCRQFEQNIGSLDDVTIDVFLFPLEELHPGATIKARAIWCADDRASAWNAWMHDRTEPRAADCKTDPLATLQTLGRKLKVYGTPTMFFADGHRKEGAISREELERELGAVVAAAPR